MNDRRRHTIGILVYDRCDPLDIGGPYEALLTAGRLLARAGPGPELSGRRATTYHEDLDALAARGDVGSVVGGVRCIGDERVVTAAGLSSGPSLGLHLVERLVDRELALATARQLEHPFDPEGRDGVAAPVSRSTP